MASNRGTRITETRGPNCAPRRPSGNERTYLVLAAWPFGLDLALRYSGRCATHLGSARAHSVGAEFCASSRKCTTLLWRWLHDARSFGAHAPAVPAPALAAGLRWYQKPYSPPVPSGVKGTTRRCQGLSTTAASRAVETFVSWRAKTNVWRIVASLRTDLARLSSEPSQN